MNLPIVHHRAYDAHPLPEKHRFPMRKFRALAAHLENSGVVEQGGFHSPAPAPANWLKLAHAGEYVDRALNGTLPRQISREIGFPLGDNETGRAIIDRGRHATAGTVLTATLALEHGLACNTAGGSHHARSDQGAGFCVFNDVAVAIRVLQADNRIQSALVIDLDVHQGDGTAHIFADDPDVFTLSVHAEKNYPVRKAASDLDIPLPDETGDDAYLNALETSLGTVTQRVNPDIVFYNAGVDPHLDDRLGRLCLSDDGLSAREEMVLRTCTDRSWPIACVIGGGYSNDIPALAARHAILHKTAARIWKAAA